ncbi:MAG: recombinase family protein, partial [Clostridia bacterium]|nr:recombinase family protein [Clostridia bacterium]
MQKYVIALYIRLSIEDYKYESMSIENQRLVLNAHAASMPEYENAEILEFVDNGYTGTNFERPQVQKLIEMVRKNKIDCIIVKDFSRFGRNSIE